MKSPPWIMKFFTTRWKVEPLKHNFFPVVLPLPFSPASKPKKHTVYDYLYITDLVCTSHKPNQKKQDFTDEALKNVDTNTVKYCILNWTTGLSPEVYSYTDSKRLILSDQHRRDANKTEMNTGGWWCGCPGDWYIFDTTVSWRHVSLISISAGEKKDPCIDPKHY